MSTEINRLCLYYVNILMIVMQLWLIIKQWMFPGTFHNIVMLWPSLVTLSSSSTFCWYFLCKDSKVFSKDDLKSTFTCSSDVFFLKLFISSQLLLCSLSAASNLFSKSSFLFLSASKSVCVEDSLWFMFSIVFFFSKAEA